VLLRGCSLYLRQSRSPNGRIEPLSTALYHPYSVLTEYRGLYRCADITSTIYQSPVLVLLLFSTMVTIYQT
jgi:hypothetical protein